ncbi:aminotransferase class I/II-fold pyridoxal phosphate-dependent enzyme [Bifidobacterium aquikefiricola]|uniref:Aminotransferase class I/II-fold pyridoxal phosphate-dependent enzyme n=1 Tax=Bifidobacterium aquikefiricola TaxID=3059038 RepID=A0AB39U7J2_9BIFI
MSDSIDTGFISNQSSSEENAANLARLILQTSTSPTPHQIMDSISSLIASGFLKANDRLPTVRMLAKSLSISPASVSAAYHSLVRVGSIRTRGRSGTFVLPQTEEWLPNRQEQLAVAPVERTFLDLSQGTPDPMLLPDIRPFFTRLGVRKAFVNSYSGPTIIAPLEDVLRHAWPYKPDTITMVSGALDGISRTLDTIIDPGDFVLTEDPTYPPLLDMIEARGGMIIGVPIDEAGMTPYGLDKAIEAAISRQSRHTGPSRQIKAMIVQPRAQNPTGASYDQVRISQLVHILRQRFPNESRFPYIIEDDSSGAIANASPETFASLIPERVVHILSFSKSHGPDLRLAALSSNSEMVGRIVARRMLGPGWVSRFLQELLFEMLTDRSVIQQIVHSRHVYALRQQSLSALLQQHGVAIRPGDGLNMWIPVNNEQAALQYLAEHTIRVAPGTPFRPPFSLASEGGGSMRDLSGSSAGPGLRITVVGDEGIYGKIAERIAEAAALR